MNKYLTMYRKLTGTAVAAMLVLAGTALGAQTWDCGSNGPNVTASVQCTLDDDGIFTVSGRGAMHGFSSPAPGGGYNYNIPWNSSKSAIKSVVIEDGVTQVPDLAFSNCANLTSVVIPIDISISAGAFQSSNITTVSNGATIAIVSPDLPLTISGEGAMINWLNRFFSTDIRSSMVIGEGVTSIGSGAFYGCTGLASIVIPERVTSIGASAFYGCTGLTSIVIPEGVTSIGSGAFNGCTGLTSIVVPEGVDFYSNNPFINCRSIDTIVSGAITATVSGTTLTISGEGESSNYIESMFTSRGITNLIIGDGVTSIRILSTSRSSGGSFLSHLPNLTSITIGTGITAINVSSLLAQTELTNIAVSESNTAYSSDARVLFNKDKTELIRYVGGPTYTIPNSVTSIGNYAFLDRVDLTSITIGNGVTSIGDEAFRNCTSLTSVTIPNNVTDIGWSAFSGCTNLTSVTIPDGLTTIAPLTFAGTGLTSINIPVSVTLIDDQAFENCTGLTSVTISNGVTKIDHSAFRGCSNLTTVTIGSGVVDLGSSVFRSTGLTTVISLNPVPPPVTSNPENLFMDVNVSAACLYVPEASIAAYKAAPGWDVFDCVQDLESAPTTSILTYDRVVPVILNNKDAAVVAPVVSAAFEVSAGPNPARQSDGAVRFFANANSSVTGTLTIYDATGNVVSKIPVNNGVQSVGNVPTIPRTIAVWGLRDARGRVVSAGTYLVRGSVTVNGKREKVSLMVGVR